VWPGYHGAFIGRSPNSASSWFSANDGDYVLQQPALALPRGLTQDDLDAFSADSVDAATHFGIVGQDKKSNQDFACAAAWDADDRRLRFAAVADGVSTKTFWAARGARIAALAAYMRARADGARLLDAMHDDAAFEVARETFIANLSQDLRVALEADRAVLEKLTDPEWSDSIFARFRSRIDWWHQTTLLFALADDTGWIAFVAGDGALIAAGPDGARIVCNSPDTLRIERFVSHDVSPAMFLCERSAPGEVPRELMVMTDGPDRTIQVRASRNGRDLGAAYNADLRSDALKTTLQRLAASEDVDRDNLSLAVISLPGTFPRRRPARKIVRMPGLGLVAFAVALATIAAASALMFGAPRPFDLFARLFPGH
jgi:hypothetical protein